MFFFHSRYLKIRLLGYTSKFQRKENIMKRLYYLIVVLCLMFFLFTSTYAGVFKWIKVGKYQCYVLDSADECESKVRKGSYYYYHGFIDYMYESRGWAIGARDWIDEKGKTLPVKVTAQGLEGVDELYEIMPVPDAEGITIRRYMRYQRPTITVDGVKISEPFPFDEADEVNPNKIPGTADIMVESRINTSIGVTIHQRALAWSQKNHDDYVIYIWTFKNTGNIDLDPNIELPNQTLKDLYFFRSNRDTKHISNPRGSWWHSAYGEHIGDSLRIQYFYSSRAPSATYDSFGNIENKANGFPVNPEYTGEATLHVDKSPSNHKDDPSQPQMTDAGNIMLIFFLSPSGKLTSSDDMQLYQTMQYSTVPIQPGWAYMDDPDIYPGTHHAKRFENSFYKYPDDPFGRAHLLTMSACGPYTLAPGDSITIIRASVLGLISPEKAWEVGDKWVKGTAAPPTGMVFGVTDNLPPPFKKYPDFYKADAISTEYNNWAKDCWVATGKDSLFQNAWNAQWNVRNNYNVPTAPPPPSIEVKSLPDRIKIAWGTESESVSDFAGYRVYKTLGSPYYSQKNKVVVGSFGNFVPIFECGKGTANTLTHSYEDMAAKRGVAYYYYVTAFDDGIGNIIDVHGKKEILESGQYLNMTTVGAYLTRPAGTLSTARVVPNPFNISAGALQYPGQPDKIMFLDLPAYCTIKIYTESGDLIKTLYHTSGSGDESWGVILEEHSATDTGQIIVSGIYIAVIIKNNEDGTPTGEKTVLKFVVVR